MTTYYCSDPHAFHANILKYCRRLTFMTDLDRESFLAHEAAGGDLRDLHLSDESVNRMNHGLVENINAEGRPKRHPLVPRRLGFRARQRLFA